MRYLGEPNAVYLDGFGHDGDSRNAGSSDGLRVAGGMAEMKMLDIATARHCRRGPARAYPATRDAWPGRPPMVILETAQFRAPNDWTSGPDLGKRWTSRLVATAAEKRLNARRNLHTSFGAGSDYRTRSRFMRTRRG
jgi:hypothetical protein